VQIFSRLILGQMFSIGTFSDIWDAVAFQKEGLRIVLFLLLITTKIMLNSSARIYYC